MGVSRPRSRSTASSRRSDRHIFGRGSRHGGRGAPAGPGNPTVQAPMGERRSTLTLSTAGGTLTGKQEAEGNTTDIADGTGNGNALPGRGADPNPSPLTAPVTGA